MHLKTLIVLFYLTLIILFSCSENKTPSSNKITICPTNGNWCESPFNQHKIAIRFPKKIPYLTKFPVQVRIKNKNKINIQQLQIQFSMQGMQMGINRFNLKPKLNQEDSNTQFWQAEVVLPVCVSGRKDWLVELKVNEFTHFFSITIN